MTDITFEYFLLIFKECIIVPLEGLQSVFGLSLFLLPVSLAEVNLCEMGVKAQFTFLSKVLQIPENIWASPLENAT